MNLRHGLEYELQMVAEVNERLTVIEAGTFFNWKELHPNVVFDLGNLEIQSAPCDSYQLAVENANYILLEKLVPAIIKFGVKKFALFLPVPMCRLYDFMNADNGAWNTGLTRMMGTSDNIGCLKHWNISYFNKEITSGINKKLENEDYIIYTNKYNFYKDIALEDVKKNWKYNYSKLEAKGYHLLLKDLEIPYSSRVHIKIPYHYQPINSNPDLMPDFYDILIPPDNWRSLVGYYKNGHWTTVRKLI